MASILVVDDERNVRLLLKRILERAGYQVTEASNGEEAIRHLGARHYDLAIMDVVMPGKGGIETLMDIHSDYSGLKVIVISGKVDVNSTSFRNLASHFGASRIVRKPFDVEGLLREVDGLLRSPG
jgi:DNA-binding NtrC family response regulator